MQRRLFLQLSAFTAAFITFPFVSGCGDHIAEAESQPAFFSQFADIKTIKEAGQAYISTFKNEGTADKLRALLIAQAGSSNNAGVVREALIKAIGSDFKNNEVVSVSGWFLSKTEARQCALYYLLNS